MSVISHSMMAWGTHDNQELGGDIENSGAEVSGDAVNALDTDMSTVAGDVDNKAPESVLVGDTSQFYSDAQALMGQIQQQGGDTSTMSAQIMQDLKDIAYNGGCGGDQEQNFIDQVAGAASQDQGGDPGDPNDPSGGSGN